jgi:hydrogenase nickel incorporation protein HypA/HybF
MHELSIAHALIDVIHEALMRDGHTDPPTSVTVEVGTLSGVVPAALVTAFAAAVVGTPFPRCRLCVEAVDVALWCDRCGGESAAQGPAILRCARCGEASARVVRGRELDLIRIEWGAHAATHP